MSSILFKYYELSTELSAQAADANQFVTPLYATLDDLTLENLRDLKEAVLHRKTILSPQQAQPLLGKGLIRLEDNAAYVPTPHGLSAHTFLSMTNPGYLLLLTKDLKRSVH